MGSPETGNKEIRFTEIDLLRLLSALSVALYHYTFFGFAYNDYTVRNCFPFISQVSKYGFLGFHFFFLISGFVILMSANNKTAKEFVISRFVRLYPAYWFCCSLTFFITFFLGKSLFKVNFLQWLFNLTMFNGFFHTPYIDGVYWTLFVEMKFYIFIFGLLLFKQMRFLQYYLGAWLIVSIFAYYHPIHTLMNYANAEYSAYFIAGATYYLIYSEGKSFYRIFLLIGSFLLAFKRGIVTSAFMSNNYQIEFNTGIILAIIASFFFIFLLISHNKTGFLRSKYFVYLGVLTYPLYLLHYNLGMIIFKITQNHVDHILILIITCFIMIMLAWIVHIKIEKKYSIILKKSLEKLA
ncbi:MAG TPA: acyltransferase [Hanamia sp.]